MLSFQQVDTYARFCTLAGEKLNEPDFCCKTWPIGCKVPADDTVLHNAVRNITLIIFIELIFTLLFFFSYMQLTVDALRLIFAYVLNETHFCVLYLVCKEWMSIMLGSETLLLIKRLPDHTKSYTTDKAYIREVLLTFAKYDKQRSALSKNNRLVMWISRTKYMLIQEFLTFGMKMDEIEILTPYISGTIHFIAREYICGFGDVFISIEISDNTLTNLQLLDQGLVQLQIKNCDCHEFIISMENDVKCDSSSSRGNMFVSCLHGCTCFCNCFKANPLFNAKEHIDNPTEIIAELDYIATKELFSFLHMLDRTKFHRDENKRHSLTFKVLPPRVLSIAMRYMAIDVRVYIYNSSSDGILNTIVNYYPIPELTDFFESMLPKQTSTSIISVRQSSSGYRSFILRFKAHNDITYTMSLFS